MVVPSRSRSSLGAPWPELCRPSTNAPSSSGRDVMSFRQLVMARIQLVLMPDVIAMNRQSCLPSYWHKEQRTVYVIGYDLACAKRDLDSLTVQRTKESDKRKTDYSSFHINLIRNYRYRYIICVVLFSNYIDIAWTQCKLLFQCYCFGIIRSSSKSTGGLQKLLQQLSNMCKMVRICNRCGCACKFVHSTTLSNFGFRKPNYLQRDRSSVRYFIICMCF